jgi:hypothetical protein
MIRRTLFVNGTDYIARCDKMFVCRGDCEAQMGEGNHLHLLTQDNLRQWTILVVDQTP